MLIQTYKKIGDNGLDNTPKLNRCTSSSFFEGNIIRVMTCLVSKIFLWISLFSSIWGTRRKLPQHCAIRCLENFTPELKIWSLQHPTFTENIVNHSKSIFKSKLLGCFGVSLSFGFANRGSYALTE